MRTLLLLLLLRASCAGRAAEPTRQQRLCDLFDCLSRTHGGPSYRCHAQLLELREQALGKLNTALADSLEAGEDAERLDASLTSTCEWAMAQLGDPHAAYIQPSQAEEMSDRYHGRVELGVRTRDEPCRDMTGLWHSLCLPPKCRSLRTFVTAVNDRSPAARAGLRVGDEILEVAGTSLQGGSEHERAEVEVLLQANEGTRVPITIRRTGCDRPIRLSVKCTLLPPKTVFMRLVRLPRAYTGLGGVLPLNLPDKVVVDEYAAVLHIQHFGAGTAGEVEAELMRLSTGELSERVEKGGPKCWRLPVKLPSLASRAAPWRPQRRSVVRAILFDLRDNGGGVLKAAVQSSRLMLPRGSHILSLQKQRQGSLRTVSVFRRRWYHRSTPFAARPILRACSKDRHATRSGVALPPADMPILVLVNKNTASAAEVFTAALSHAGRALVLGSRTFGKGTSQAFVSMDDGHALTFTVYSLAAGARGPTHPLNNGVTPHLKWSWSWRPNAASSPADREIVLATQAGLAAFASR